jgi:hypothetical protein
MARDYALDESYAGLAKALRTVSARKSKVEAPLIATGHIQQWLADPELRDFAERINTCEEWVESIWGHPSGLVQYCERRGHFNDVLDYIPELTGDAIAEGLVAAKTVRALTDRIADEDDARYLEANKHALQLFPENLPPLYNIAHCVYDAVLGRFLNPQQWKLEEVWPLRYANSPRAISDIGFMYLADIALHIPPPSTVSSRVHAGRNAPEDFLPAFRFCKAVDSIRRRGGFPPDDPSESPEFFYMRVFDSIASDPQLRWPTFQETNDHWKIHLALFKQTRREAADGYRFRLVVEREKKPHTIVMCDPILVCWSQFAPVLHLTPSGFKFLRGMRLGDTWYLLPLEWSDMAVLEMFQSNRPLWKDMPGKINMDQFLDSVFMSEHDNAMLLHQEVIYRSICAELRSSLLYGRAFSCPFAPRGCTPGTTPCSDVKRLDCTPEENCCIRAYLAQDRIDPACVVWNDTNEQRVHHANAERK